MDKTQNIKNFNLTTHSGFLELHSDINDCVSDLNVGVGESILYREMRLFTAYRGTPFAHKYEEIGNCNWEFYDRFNNRLGCTFDIDNGTFDCYYFISDGAKIHDLSPIKDRDDVEFTSVLNGGVDENRPDTWLKILIDRVIPTYLINGENKYIKISSVEKYRYEIFEVISEICKEKYSQIEIEKTGTEIYIRKIQE